MSNGVPDEIDLKILQLLQTNARIDMVELGRRVNLTRTPATYRVEKLQQQGFIKGYVALLDRDLEYAPVTFSELIDNFGQTWQAMPQLLKTMQLTVEHEKAFLLKLD